jgi:hypothetical protein
MRYITQGISSDKIKSLHIYIDDAVQILMYNY